MSFWLSAQNSDKFFKLTDLPQKRSTCRRNSVAKEDMFQKQLEDWDAWFLLPLLDFHPLASSQNILPFQLPLRHWREKDLKEPFKAELFFAWREFIFFSISSCSESVQMKLFFYLPEYRHSFQIVLLRLLADYPFAPTHGCKRLDKQHFSDCSPMGVWYD